MATVVSPSRSAEQVLVGFLTCVGRELTARLRRRDAASAVCQSSLGTRQDRVKTVPAEGSRAYNGGMTTHRDHRYVPEDALQAIGLAIGGFGPLLVAGLLVPFRTDHLVSTNVALVFVMVVILAAAQGGRRAGVVAALVSTMSYDFFFTRPFGSLKIQNSHDIGTAVLLLAIGLLVAQLVGFAHLSHRRSERSHDDTRRVHRVAELVASGAPVVEVVDVVDAEIAELLSLRECRFEEGVVVPDLPEVGRNGALDSGRRHYVGTELSLPAEGAIIRVLGRGRTLGQLVLVPEWDVGVSLDARRSAVAIADQLGAALAAEAAPLRPRPSARAPARRPPGRRRRSPRR
jgi:hypothetical protein